MKYYYLGLALLSSFGLLIMVVKHAYNIMPIAIIVNLDSVICSLWSVMKEKE